MYGAELYRQIIPKQPPLTARSCPVSAHQDGHVTGFEAGLAAVLRRHDRHAVFAPMSRTDSPLASAKVEDLDRGGRAGALLLAGAQPLQASTVAGTPPLPTLPVAPPTGSAGDRLRRSPIHERSIPAPATVMARRRRRASSICPTPAGGRQHVSTVPARSKHRFWVRGYQIAREQRPYSANARVITTTDEMLHQLIRISRQ
jgi:hypothetical protein